jgi:membrane fusion protein (multidrug efflux system)
LAIIEDREYRSKLLQATAGLNLSQANIDNLQARLEVQRISVQEYTSKFAAAKIEAKLQTTELDRYKTILRKGHVSQAAYDLQEAREQQARASMNAADQQLRGIQQQLVASLTERDRLDALQRQATANVDLAMLMLERTRITAPVAGVVANRRSQVGRLVAPGTPILSLVPLDKLWIEANFKEAQVEHMRVGQAVDIRLDRLPGESLVGRVESIAPATGSQFSLIPANNATGNFVKIVQRIPVRIKLEVPDRLYTQIVPGLSAEVAVHLAEP